MAKKPRISVKPTKAKKGDTIMVKSLFSHPMETGRRKDKDGNVIPRLIINKHTVTLNGKEVFRADLDTAVSADPYIAFPMRATESGKLEFTWIDDNGKKVTASKDITVE